MPAFRYEASRPDGRIDRGLIEAENDRAARSALRTRGLVPLKVSSVAETPSTPRGGPQGLRRRVFTTAARTVWTRQLAGLVSAGLPLERALTALTEEASDERQRELVAHLRSQVNEGVPFAQALASAGGAFDSVYCAVVAAGEQSGALGEVLNRLADDLEAQQTLKAKLIGATLYPAIVSVIALAIVIFLVTYVVPQVAGVFTGSKRSLPFLTVAMLSLSAGIRQWGWLMALVALGGAAGLMAALRQPVIRLRWDAAWLRLPVVGGLARGYNAARFAGTLAMLAGAGVPILKALQAAAQTLNNASLKADALTALDAVREGAPVASALAAHRRFPGLLSMFIRLGEQTGTLPQMLQRAAQQLSNDVQRRAMALATILEPLLIVGMGAVVMVIVLAVLMPIIELNTWAK